MKRKHIETDATAKIPKISEEEKKEVAYQSSVSDSTDKKNNEAKIPYTKTKKKLNPLLPDAYNQKDVLGLQPLNKWGEEEKQIHLQHNRILQPGFMYRDSRLVITDAQLVNIHWLTAICCPSIKAALILHIAKELVVNYKVKEEELNIAAKRVYDSLLASNSKVLTNLEIQIENELNNMMKLDINKESLNKQVANMLSDNKINDPTIQQLAAAKRLTIDVERKRMTDELVSTVIKKHLAINAATLDLKKKSVYEIGKTHDYVFLGAAGSGKSTIAKQYLNENQKTDYIILATDNYRVFTMPNTEEHENKETKNIFIRTQDIAYMVKELVHEEIDSNVRNQKCRSNVICDCITLDRHMRKLLAQGEVTSVVAAYRGKPGYEGIVERADQRARDSTASPADKGRYVEKTALLKGHANFSQQLLSNIPENITTIIYDTNVESGSTPVELAKVDNKSHTVEISNLRVMSEFLNKRNININPVNQIDILFIKNPLNLLASHPENKAKSILDLIPSSEYKSAYTVKLINKDQYVYAELVPDGDKVKLNILDRNIYLSKINADTVEATVLRAITRQVKLGSLKASLSAAFDDGDKNSCAKILMEMENAVTEYKPSQK